MFITSEKVAPDPVSAVQSVNPGPGARCQLYVGPEDAGVPVDAAVIFVMLTVCPAHIFDPPMDPPLLAVEYTVISLVVETGLPQPKVAVLLYL